jgi:hypothetical protein
MKPSTDEENRTMPSPSEFAKRPIPLELLDHEAAALARLCERITRSQIGELSGDDGLAFDALDDAIFELRAALADAGFPTLRREQK